MFGTLRKIAAVGVSRVAAIASALRKTPNPQAQPEPRRIPLLRVRPAVNPCRVFYIHPNGGKTPRVKGQRDHSLKSRSNRRKGAAKSKARR